MKKLIKKLTSSKLYLASVIIFLSIIIAIISFAYLKNISDSISKQKYEELSAIAELKVNQLTQWIAERNSEAKFFSENPTYIDNTLDLLSDSQNRSAKESLQKGLLHIKEQHGYENIFVVSAESQILFSLDENEKELSNAAMKFIDSSLANNTIVFSDFYFCDISNKYHLDIIAPIKNNEANLIAVMLFRFDPERYLYPLIQTWPLPSKTSETLLVRQVKDSVEFITELRHIPNEPHSLKISLDDKEVPAVQAVLGYRGIWEGIDYRGEKVVADIRPIANTNWLMIAKIDKDEILSELYSSFVYVILFGFFVILFISALAVSIYAYRKSTIYKELLETEEEFKTTLYSIGDAVITTDKKGNVKYLNQVAQTLTGWNENEAKGRRLKDIFNIVNEDTRAAVESPIKKVLENGTIEDLSNNTLLISKNGTEIPIADSGAPIKNEEGKILGVVLVFRDITKEREQNIKIIESEKQFRLLFQSIRDAILVANTERTIIDCNDAFSEIFGYSLEEIKGKKTLSVYENEEQYKELGKAIKEHFGDKPFNYTVNFKRNDGTIFPGETSVFYLKDIDGNITGIIGLIRDVTERKRAEEALHQNEKKMRSIYSVAPTGIGVVVNRALKEVNPRICEMTGYTKEELIERNAQILYPSREEYELVGKEKYEQIRKTGTGKVETLWQKKDGTIINVLLASAPIDINDYSKGVTFTALDITERKKAEKELKNTLEATTDGIWTWDFKTDVLYFSPKYYTMLGYNPNEFEANFNNWTDMIHPDDKANALKVVEQYLETKPDKYENEFRIRTKDGDYRWIQTKAKVVERDKDGKALYMIGNHEDITKSKKIENELKEKSSFLSTIMETSPVGIVTVDKTGNITYANYRAEQILGLEKEEITSRTYDAPLWESTDLDGSPLPDEKQPFNIVKKSLKTVLNIQHGITYPDGTVVILSINATPIKDNNGEFNGMIASIEDITERKQAEEALHRIEWMLSKKAAAVKSDQTPLYGDLSELNTNRLILDSVGSKLLHEIANDYLSLMDTSSAIYEKNGDYALGIFASGWCRFMDQASRDLCNTKDNKEALACGKWLCHESCWNEASLPAMKSGEPVDIECKGGIRLYAIPIKAGDETIGAINFGYSDPPQSQEKLIELSENYNVSIDKLIEKSKEYESRPPYVIETAKKRLQSSAHLIGEIVNRKLAEDELKELKGQLEVEVEQKTEDLQQRVSELERFHEATIDRELRMKELREEIKRLKGEK